MLDTSRSSRVARSVPTGLPLFAVRYVTEKSPQCLACLSALSVAYSTRKEAWRVPSLHGLVAFWSSWQSHCRNSAVHSLPFSSHLSVTRRSSPTHASQATPYDCFVADFPRSQFCERTPSTVSELTVTSIMGLSCTDVPEEHSLSHETLPHSPLSISISFVRPSSAEKPTPDVVVLPTPWPSPYSQGLLRTCWWTDRTPSKWPTRSKCQTTFVL